MSGDAREVRRRAMDLMALREHGRAELERKLAAKGFAPTLVAGELDRLAAEGLLSDERFAERFVRSRIERGHGPRRIERDLERRGLAGERVALALEAADADWSTLAGAAREKRFGPGLPQAYRERARQARFLEGRGFSAEQIRAALGGAVEG